VWPPAAAVSERFELPSPPAVRQPAAAAWKDRDLVVSGRPVADVCLPPPPPAWPPAAAVSVHFPVRPRPAAWPPALAVSVILPLPPPPAVGQPAAAAWPDRQHVGRGHEW